MQGWNDGIKIPVRAILPDANIGESGALRLIGRSRVQDGGLDGGNRGERSSYLRAQEIIDAYS